MKNVGGAVHLLPRHLCVNLGGSKSFSSNVRNANKVVVYPKIVQKFRLLW